MQEQEVAKNVQRRLPSAATPTTQPELNLLEDFEPASAKALIFDPLVSVSAFLNECMHHDEMVNIAIFVMCQAKISMTGDLLPSQQPQQVSQVPAIF
ncbi:uncharacterized protein CCR75_001526 [Bremia lactucae]|uniref:Uncharacterized protein n=1 Tax=Bremia lactucae TaxID=4779 RepID=A0A976IB70_BRELC|nr:hypothetical protein CCR75_001526 [Bremia lactucae]